MKQELIVTGATIEEALQNGALEIGVKPEDLEYEVLVEPKKGILGIGKVAAKLKVSYTADPAELAMDFIRTLLANMEADAQVEMEKGEGNERLIKISGKDAGSLIGYHGETLDALQYLANLAANKKSDETDERNYTRILLDIENYREKRAETLKALARRMAHRVLKYKRNVTLEPMSSYERRIIHSEIQGIEGVTTYSVGADNNRKVVIQLED
ncbi:MAG: protein jag [Clostridia bacterium]|nr:protein jag [Clostridia bacterium]